MTGIQAKYPKNPHRRRRRRCRPRRRRRLKIPTKQAGARQVDYKCNEIVLSHYPRKMICAVLDV